LEAVFKALDEGQATIGKIRRVGRFPTSAKDWPQIFSIDKNMIFVLGSIELLNKIVFRKKNFEENFGTKILKKSH
jgi:hypothetical protein